MSLLTICREAAAEAGVAPPANEYLSVLARAIARDGGRPTLRLDGAAPGDLAAAIPDGNFPERL